MLGAKSKDAGQNKSLVQTCVLNHNLLSEFPAPNQNIAIAITTHTQA